MLPCSAISFEAMLHDWCSVQSSSYLAHESLLLMALSPLALLVLFWFPLFIAFRLLLIHKGSFMSQEREGIIVKNHCFCGDFFTTTNHKEKSNDLKVNVGRSHLVNDNLDKKICLRLTATRVCMRCAGPGKSYLDKKPDEVSDRPAMQTQSHFQASISTIIHFFSTWCVVWMPNMSNAVILHNYYSRGNNK